MSQVSATPKVARLHYIHVVVVATRSLLWGLSKARIKRIENLDKTLEANKENLLVTAFTSGAITNGAIKKGAILLEKTENISMCEFDEEWWPLISNIWTRYNYKNHTNGNSWKTFACRFTKYNPSSMQKKVYIERYQDSPDHIHTIEESEKLKRSQFVRNLVEQETIKNYLPPAIVNAIKEYAIEKLDLSSSVKELRRKEVTNIKSKVYKLQNTYLTGNINLELDIEESVVFFKNQEYQVEHFQILYRSSHGFVFAHPNQLEKLQHFGWLTLIDSTHKTNKYDWRLFTLYIWDNHSCWDVGAHFFVSKEDSDTVTEALKIIRRNVEANGIAIAFPGLSKGEQNCEVIFCTVHVIRTWMTKIYETKVQRKIIHVLHKITKIGCDELIQQTIDKCQAPTVKQYILRNYIKNTNQWALWACQHFSFLLQITSTNAIKSYHSELKRTTVFHHGACHKIIAFDTKKRSDAEYIAFEFHTKQISVIGIDFEIIDQIHKFPFPIQQKIVSEVHAVEKRIEKGKDVPVLTSLNCYCLFFRQYLLPCWHIFHNHLYDEKKLLTTNAWEQFQQMFIESGFEVYISHELVEIELPKKTKAEKAMENQRSTINELIERTRNAYWRVEEKGNAVQKSTFIETLKASLGSILNAEEQ
ncbi:hypothetical protein Glove_299g65 [Diversispora epigaea]|uniref:ZSWIM1/3 RNaseH-like domain-containing protein n=1 Tax=Diversispora epigaea TaxID=1348612 RepID=A0A397HX06_9GLOM|nr:hypothetical protein Glove_299g65 [Diversispora epigaea]